VKMDSVGTIQQATTSDASSVSLNVVKKGAVRAGETEACSRAEGRGTERLTAIFRVAVSDLHIHTHNTAQHR